MKLRDDSSSEWGKKQRMQWVESSLCNILAFPRQKHLPVCCALGVGHSHTSWAAMSRPLGTVAMGRSPAVTINRLCCPLRKRITFVKVGEQLKLMQFYFPSWTLAGNGRLEPGTSKQLALTAIWEDCTEQAFQEEAGQVPGASGRSQETEQLENPQIKTPGAAMRHFILSV